MYLFLRKLTYKWKKLFWRILSDEIHRIISLFAFFLMISIWFGVFLFLCLFVCFFKKGKGVEGRLKYDIKRIIMWSFSRPKWMTIKSSQPHKRYKKKHKKQKKSPSSRIRTSDLRISINVSTVLRSTNWAIEGASTYRGVLAEMNP